jgi:hypothetical protein
VTPASCWSSSGATPQARVDAKCGAYSSRAAKVISAPSSPICTVVARMAASAAAGAARRTASQKPVALASSVSCIST